MDARYDAVADSYDRGEDGDSRPAVDTLLELVGSCRGQRVLDLACGPGRVARALAQQGAHVTGVDISTRMLARARSEEERAPLGIRYVHSDVTEADSLTGSDFEIVVSNFGLSDIDDLPAACATVARVLTAGGVFAFSILHPCFPGVADTSGSWPSGGTYHDEGWWRADGERSTLRRVVGSNHRTVSTYVNVLSDHGLVVERLAEPAAARSWAIDRPGVEQLPLYLVARCRFTG